MKHVTADHILIQLRTGTSTLHELAVELHADEERIKLLIAELLSKGRIAVSKHATREVRYKIAQSKPKAKERLTTSVAEPIAPPPLTGEIQGYAREMRERVELAMLGRGRS